MVNFIALRLLRRHVGWRSHHQSGLRGTAISLLGDAEVQYLDYAPVRQHDVGRLEVAMNHASLMRKANRAANLFGVRKQSRQPKRPRLFQP